MDNSIKEGTLIRGSQLNRDLLPAFLIELYRIDPNALTGFAVVTQGMSLNHWLIQSITRPEASPRIAPDHVWWNSATADQIRESAIKALSRRAPAGMRFGAHEGDDSDYGWWQVGCPEVDNAIKEGTVIRGTRGTGLNRDLIPAFANELHRISPEAFVQWSKGGSCPTWLADAVQLSSSEWLPPEHGWWGCALADRICRQLEKELDELAPIGMGFGLIECPTGQAYGWYRKAETQKPDEALAGGGTLRRVPVCWNCESPDLVAEEVRSRWNVVTQAWEMFELGESFICQECGHQGETFEWGSADAGLSPDELFECYGDAGHPEHTQNAWIQAAAIRQTILGYWAWVHDKINDDV